MRRSLMIALGALMTGGGVLASAACWPDVTFGTGGSGGSGTQATSGTGKASSTSGSTGSGDSGTDACSPCMQPLSGPSTGKPSCTNGSCGVDCNAQLAACPMGQGYVCANPDTDPQYCGSACAHCPGGQTCVSGLCQTKCTPGLTLVGTSCVNLQSDPNNCGTVGMTCSGAMSACSNGVCALLGACLGANMMSCSAGGGLSACANTQTDSNHCGGCTACPADHVCVGGACKPYIFASAQWECMLNSSFPSWCPSTGICVGPGATCP
jgi:hypothetical protein